MKKIAILVPSLGFALAIIPPTWSQAQVATTPTVCPKTIVFLPQSHRNVFDKSAGSASVDEIAVSQFKVASYLQANPQVTVFSEQVDTDMTSEAIRGDLKTVAEELNQVFPSGIPQHYSQMTPQQKNRLVFTGADGLLFLTGRISKLHKVVPNRATQDELFAKIAAGLKGKDFISPESETYQLLTTTRERLALGEIQKYFAANPSEKNAALIYGRLHDFKRHHDIFPGNCIQIPDGF